MGTKGEIKVHKGRLFRRYMLPKMNSLVPVANHALSVFPELNHKGFEASKVFALTALYLAHPPASFSSRRVHQADLAREYVFNISSSENPDNVATWHISVGPKIRIGRGRPRTPIFQRRNRVVIECSDYDFIDLATGKIRSTELYQNGKIKVTGNRAKALEISKLISHERRKLYAVVDDPKPVTGPNVYDEAMYETSVVPYLHSKL